MREADFYEKLDKGAVQCGLCAHNCRIPAGRRGLCNVRENREGRLYSLVYGRLAAFNVDPIEKKPLFHFLPGTESLSIATVGCNFRCRHCQNYELSQFCPSGSVPVAGREMLPGEVVQAAEDRGCRSISYTYTEPTINYEFTLACAELASSRGIRNVFVSNGYTSAGAARKIAPWLDANNIDLKGSDSFYRTVCGAGRGAVLETIRLMKELGVWVEVTTLIIPGLNDSEKDLTEIAEFIASVDPAIPWHVSQFYPTYKLTDRPRTPVATLQRARETGLKAGLKYVYQGNVPGGGGENTFCPECRQLLVGRSGYRITENRMRNGRCPACSASIEGVWD